MLSPALGAYELERVTGRRSVIDLLQPPLSALLHARTVDVTGQAKPSPIQIDTSSKRFSTPCRKSMCSRYSLNVALLNICLSCTPQRDVWI